MNHQDDIAISVRNLTKTYRLFRSPMDRIKQALTLGRGKFHDEFTALKDVSFDIKKGETVGIIGRNGSGKSTLLQLICGIFKPTSGGVMVNGRISALLELGAGFNPEFTGRENVYFQGTLMGFSKDEMDARFDDIAAFAGIGEFIDQPVRTYSSGMFVRLAFAVAISVSPDILLVDEALAVGDTRFQGRCFERISEIRARGGTILLVTHALEQVAHFCDRALLLDRGILLADGNTKSTVSRYLAELNSSSETSTLTYIPPDIEDRFSAHPAYNRYENRWGDRMATINDIHIIQDGKHNPEVIVPGHVAELKIHVHFHADVNLPIYGLAIKSPTGALAVNTNSRHLLGPRSAPPQNAGDKIVVSFFLEPFLDRGDYLLSFGVVSESASGLVPHDRRYDAIQLRINSPQYAQSDVGLGMKIDAAGSS